MKNGFQWKYTNRNLKIADWNFAIDSAHLKKKKKKKKGFFFFHFKIAAVLGHEGGIKIKRPLYPSEGCAVIRRHTYYIKDLVITNGFFFF